MVSKRFLNFLPNVQDEDFFFNKINSCRVVRMLKMKEGGLLSLILLFSASDASLTPGAAAQS